MKKFDLISLKNEIPYKEYNLQQDMHGIVLECDANKLDVLFFNPKNQGDYIIVKINKNDVAIEKEKLPENIIKELTAKLDSLKSKAKNKFDYIEFKSYDVVELLVEDEKYTRYGIHKGARGCVMDDNAVQDYIEVDFSGIDEYGNYYGDCISVKINDLKVIK